MSELLNSVYSVSMPTDEQKKVQERLLKIKKMNKNFVSHDLAFALKELGFDCVCYGYFTNDYRKFQHSAGVDRGYLEWFKKDDMCIVPLWQQAFKWFEKEHSIFVDRITATTPNEILGFSYYLKSWKFPPIEIEYGGMDSEVANFLCLEKLIEIVKDKK